MRQPIVWIIFTVAVLAGIAFAGGSYATYQGRDTAYIKGDFGNTVARAVLTNNIAEDNGKLILKDCGLLDCSLYVQYTAYSTNDFTEKNFAPEVAGSGIHGTEVLVWQERTKTEKQPIYSEREVEYEYEECTNKSKVGELGGEEKPVCKNLTGKMNETYISGYKDVEVDISDYYPYEGKLVAGKTYKLRYDYKKDSPNAQADLQARAGGIILTEWAWVNDYCNYSINITTRDVLIDTELEDYVFYDFMNGSSTWTGIYSDCSNVGFTDSTGSTEFEAVNIYCDVAGNSGIYRVNPAQNISNITNFTYTRWYECSQGNLSTTFNAEAFPDSYKIYLPLEDNESALDATGNYSPSIHQSGGNFIRQAGKVGYGVYTGNDASYWNLTFSDLPDDQCVETWFNITADGNADQFIWGTKASTNEVHHILYGAGSTDDWEMGIRTSSSWVLYEQKTPVNYVDNKYHHYIYCSDQSGQVDKTWIDGVVLTPSTDGNGDPNVFSFNYPFWLFGRNVNNAITGDWVGALDEFTVHEAYRSDAWIRASYQNQINNLTTQGTEVNLTGGGGGTNCTVSVSLTSPADETSSTASSQTLTATATLNAGCTNGTAMFYLDGVNVANSSLLTANGTTSTSQSIALGAHEWYVFLIGDDDTSINSTSSTWDFYRVQSPSSADGYFGYETNTIYTNSSLNDSINNYGYDLIGHHINISEMNTNWSKMLDAIAYVYLTHDRSSYISAYFESANYSQYGTECSTVNENFTDLIDYPYYDGLRFIVIQIDNEGTGNKTLFVNHVAECIMNATENNFNVYSTYENASLDRDYVANFSTNFIKVSDIQNLSYTTYEERENLRTETSTTRIYEGTNSSFQGWASSYYTGVMQNLRCTPAGVAYAGDDRVAAMGNGDVVVFNILDTEQNASINLTSKSPNDGWDPITHSLYNDLNDTVNESIQVFANNASVLYIDNLTRIVSSGVSSATLYKDVTGAMFEQNYWAGGSSAGQIQVYGSYDMLAELWDGSYGYNNLFFITYEQLPYTQEVVFDNYGIIIIAGGANTPAIVNASLTEAERNVTFGYMAVSDYDDTNETNCAVVNDWELGKMAEIDDWHQNYSILGVFIDGFDIGAVGAPACFEARIKRIMNYANNLNEETIANTYTIYQNVSHYATYGIMRESCFSRWSGDVGSPTYSYENMTLMIENAQYMSTTGKSVFCMAFGNMTDYDKMAYDYHAFAVLYGTSGNYFRYGQPNFQVQKEIRVPDFGVQRQNKYIISNSTDYYRVYENGIVHFDPTRTVPFENGEYYWFDNGETVNGIQIYGTFWKVGASACTSDHNLYVSINYNTTTQFEVDECTIEANGWNNQYNMTFPVSDYSNNGHYDVWIYEVDRGDNVGMYLYTYANTHTGQHSYKHSGTTHPPVFTYNDVLSWRTGTPGDEDTQNFRFNITINKSYSTAVDTGIDTIRSDLNSFSYPTLNSGYNYSLNASKDYNITVIGYQRYIPSTALYNITYSGIVLNYTTDSGCTGNNPSFATSNVGDLEFGVCRALSGAGYWYRFQASSLSDRDFELILGVAPDEVNLVSIDGETANANITSLTGSLAVIYNVTDADDATLDCTFLANGSNYGENSSTENYTQTTLYSTPELYRDTYSMLVSCTDGEFTKNSSALIINVSRYSPSYSNVYPPTDTNLSNQTWRFTWNCTDPYYSTVNWSFYIDGNLNASGDMGNATNYIYNITNFDCGEHTWYLECSNAANESNLSTSATIRPYPAFSGYTPANESTQVNNTNITLQVETTCIADAGWFDVDRVAGGTSYCYQETANVSTGCGGLDTGGYLCSGIWADPGASCANVSDGDWTTAGWGLAGNTGYIFINYTKPSGATNDSLWEVKDGAGQVNLSITSDCWKYNDTILTLSGYVSDGGNTGVWRCFNGTWRTLRTGGAGKLYEEAMNWKTGESNSYNFTSGIFGTIVNTSVLLNYTGQWNWTAHVNDSGDLRFGGAFYSFNVSGLGACDCPSGANWELDMGENCVLNSLCNLSGYNISFIDIGTFTVNNTLYIDTFTNLTNGMTVYITSNGLIYPGQ